MPMRVHFSDPLTRTLCDLLCALYSTKQGEWQMNLGYDRWGVNRLKYWKWAETTYHGPRRTMIRLTPAGIKVAQLVWTILDKSEVEKVL